MGYSFLKFLGNSRILVIASEAKQSLGILDFLGNSRILLAFRLDKSSLARKFYKGYALNP